MLNKTVIMDLLKNGEYAEIVEHFTVEYKLLLQSFLTKNNIETAEDDSMIDIIYKVVPKDNIGNNILRNLLRKRELGIDSKEDYTMLTNHFLKDTKDF